MKMMNQCDGCRTKIPLVNGDYHRTKNVWGSMGCEAYRYTYEYDEQFNKAHEQARIAAKTPVRKLE